MTRRQRPPSSRVRTYAAEPHSGTGKTDTVVILAGLALCVGVAYVGWRTQVRGEKIESVFPFLAASREPARKTPAAAPASPEALPEVHRDGSTLPPPPAGASPAKPGPIGEDPDNTYFGRRERPSLPEKKTPPR